MPQGVKDVNELLCSKCYKDIEKFKKEFKSLALVPATEEGFEVLLSAGTDVDLINKDYIGGYVKHVARGDEVAIDKLVHKLYSIQGKSEGIRKTSIKNIAMEALSTYTVAKEERERALMYEDDYIKQKNSCYEYKKVTMARCNVRSLHELPSKSR